MKSIFFTFLLFFTVNTIYSQKDSCLLEEDMIFVNYEKMPIWKDGTDADISKDIYQKLNAAKINYPDELGDCRKMILQFTVTKEGKVKDPKVVRSIYYKFDEQLLKIIKEYEFHPGTYRDKPVEVTMNLPIKIRLE